MLHEKNEYYPVIDRLYSKSLVLESVGDFNPVFYFYFMDTLAHIDYSVSILAYNFHNIRNKMNMEYMRWRIDEEQKGERTLFPEFINWLKENNPEKFNSLPYLWRAIYDKSNPAGYRSFRIAINPDSNQPTPVSSFNQWIEEFFDQKFIKSIYKGGSLDILYTEFLANRNG
ncbi:hypothetical protein L1994_05460 [Methanomicrobium antiquum]|uniref:Uncharacterized protein n=2 Tax=Methanomicrobium antiquum TaxID=487686 RepID=A0AAF0FTE5_9EURY|nr:hypothetical protein [Methanomicrobium antiquum]WFN37831.1 hypothetical protein L1994_05460 [Methanomicrobium antiquum]